MDDLRVTVKVRNNLLVSAIESAGYAVGGKFAILAGINYQNLLSLVNMTSSPIDRHGNYKESIFKLCEILNKMPDELFSETQKHSTIKHNKSSATINSKIIGCLSARSLTLEDRQLQGAINDALMGLQKIESEVLKLRFGVDGREHTLKEVGEIKGVSQERVRQIEAKALRKLRHPKRSDVLKQHLKG